MFVDRKNNVTFQKTYHVKDMVIDVEKFPPVMPNKNYYASIQFLKKDQGILKLLANGSVHITFENAFKRN